MGISRSIVTLRIPIPLYEAYHYLTKILDVVQAVM